MIRQSAVTVLLELAARVVVDGPDAGGISWATRCAWSSPGERAEAARVMVNRRDQADRIRAVVDQLVTAERDDSRFVDDDWLDTIGVSAGGRRTASP